MSESPKLTGAGLAIRRLRKAKGLSVTELAERLGWDKGRLSKYETDRLSLTTDVIDEIARALNHRPEAVVLCCLKERYPKINGSEVAKLLDALVEQMAELES
jgi:transcriptional regulator with XRE-family HTH domain